MNKTDSSKKNKTLNDYKGDFAEELDVELRKIPSLKEKLLYLYQLKRQNENHNVLAGGFYYYGMVISSRLNYYDSALQYNKLHNNGNKNEHKKIEDKPKIIWKKSKEDLLALIDKLTDLGFIGYENVKDDLVSEHFCFISEVTSKKRVSTNPNYKIIKDERGVSSKGGVKTFLETFENKTKNKE